jgi:hypothetical protein
MIEDVRIEILWCCRATEGDLWPDEIAERLGLDICETIKAMEMLGDAGQLKRLERER